MFTGIKITFGEMKDVLMYVFIFMKELITRQALK